MANATRFWMGGKSGIEDPLRRRTVERRTRRRVVAAMRIALEHVWADRDDDLVCRIPRRTRCADSDRKPIANTKFYILDDRGQPVPIGIPGELYVGGDGLALGYLGRADLTRDRFIPDQFSPEIGAKLYKTGDLVRYVPGGSIEFLRRVDHQVKLRGFRIELEEIEASLQQHAGISQCAVTVRGDEVTGKRLVAHIVPTDARIVPTIEDLNSALKQRLPYSHDPRNLCSD